MIKYWRSDPGDSVGYNVHPWLRTAKTLSLNLCNTFSQMYPFSPLQFWQVSDDPTNYVVCRLSQPSSSMQSLQEGDSPLHCCFQIPLVVWELGVVAGVGVVIAVLAPLLVPTLQAGRLVRILAHLCGK